MRWKKFVGGLALSLTVATGCKQPVFMTQDDYDAVSTQPPPKDLATNPAYGSILPDISDKLTKAPPTVLDPERDMRYLSLTEAFALALENGTLGQGLGSGLSNDTSNTLGLTTRDARSLGVGALDRDSVRVFSLDPANVATDIEAALSKFDARWVTSMNWNTTDRPVGTALDAFQSRGATNAISTQAAEFRSTLIKPLPTGGVAGITFDTQYQFTNLPARVNPSYTPSLQFSFEQPLLQGFGVEINQIRPDHPGSILQGNQFPTRANNANEGILLTRLRLDQTRADFELNLQNMLLNVEVAYWNLYAAYGQLFAREIALRNNLDVWRVTLNRVKAGREKFTYADLYEAQGQYESSRSDWLGALGQVLERERNLRGLLGMKPEDGTRLVPSDTPTLAPYRPDWETALQEALLLKPELVIEREQVKATQLHLIDLKNRLLPDLRFTSTYDINGIGTRLDGPDQNNAFRNMASDHFNNWALGLRLEMPLGYRDANAGLRLGRIQLAQAYWSLRLGEDKAARYLALQYRNVIEFQRQIEMNLASLEAYNNELNVRREAVKAGQAVGVDVTLQAIRFGTAAMVQYYQFVGQYNAALANFEFAKGTLLRRDNVVIGEGPLPACAQVRAVEHEQERAKALVVRERAAPVPCAPPADLSQISLPKPDLLWLPDWLKSRPPLPPEVNDPTPALPAPRPLDQVGPGSSGASRPATGTAAPPATSPSSFGTVRPLNFPEDKKAPASLPPLSGPDLGNGPR